MDARILAHQAEIAALCQRFGVTRLEVFGSAARGVDFDPLSSDVDLLVEFGPQARRGFDILLDFEDAASALLNRRVDLVEREAIEESQNPFRKQRILAEAQPLFPV